MKEKMVEDILNNFSSKETLQPLFGYRFLSDTDSLTMVFSILNPDRINDINEILIINCNSIETIQNNAKSFLVFKINSELMAFLRLYKTINS